MSNKRYLSDIEIAQSAYIEDIRDIACSVGIPDDMLFCYGRNKAKVSLEYAGQKKDGRLILVTAMTPTPAGEGKTTTTIGLADALRRIGKKSAAALREPSLGPVFGIKGGAAGGGYAQVVPMEDINLHFTGDIHAVGAANNLLAAMVDNHIYQGNRLGIDPKAVSWRRCVDMNDRQLRNIVSGLGGRINGVPREDGFDITVASEIMAVLCLSESISDLKARLSRIVIGLDYEGRAVSAGDLNAHGAMAVLLKDAIMPNLVQTLEHTPVFMHGGPFANIAHGCNSVLATKMALKSADYAVTEAGFGSDLGAEKFFDIKCRAAGLSPSCAVVVATARALKFHGGIRKEELGNENIPALIKGMPNLLRHVRNMKDVFGIPCIVAVNRFPGDSEGEIEAIIKGCADAGADAAVSNAWAEGGRGALELAEKASLLCEKPSSLSFSYSCGDSIDKKLDDIAVNVYGATGASLLPEAERHKHVLERNGFGGLPVCVAKTQYSFSDNPALLGAPEHFSIAVRELKVSAGAGFIVALAGNIMKMPGLPKIPAAENMDIDASGKIKGLF